MSRSRYANPTRCSHVKGFEREAAEGGVLLMSDKVTPAKHVDPFNAAGQDNPSARTILKEPYGTFYGIILL